MDKISYALGISVAQNLKSTGIENLQIEKFAKGLKDELTNQSLDISHQEVNEVLNSFFSTLQSQKSNGNLSAGEAFLTENKLKDGIIELPSGLQYKILKNGTGATPKATDKVECHYHGTLINGTIFDSSVQRGTPAVFPVNGVIKGWVEALQLMNEGSKWALYIPAHLAYGDQGAGDQIGPNTTLIFEVELLKIK